MSSAGHVLHAIRATGEPVRLVPAAPITHNYAYGLTIWDPVSDTPWIGKFSYATPGSLKFWLQPDQ